MKFATAVGPDIKVPRDAPNLPADRQALGLVKPYQGMVAWPTVFVAIGIFGAFTLVTTLATMRIIPLWLGLILNTFILYPTRRRCTKLATATSPARTQMAVAQSLVGYVCGAILLHEYKAFRYMHLAHHRDTNNPEIDPDHWVAVQGPFNRVLALPHHRLLVPTAISGGTSPSMPTFPACGRSPSTSRPCTRCSMASRSGSRCSAGGARC